MAEGYFLEGFRKITRRAAIGAALAIPALGQSWPSCPIRMIVSLAAGGSTDAAVWLARPAGDAQGWGGSGESRAGALTR